MKKINLKNRMNLTLLAKAFTDNFLKRGKAGDIYYTRSDDGDTAIIYFEDEYYQKLLNQIYDVDLLNKIDQSSASNDWKNLFETLKDNEDVEFIDYGNLKGYSIVDINFETINIPEERVSKVLSLPIGDLSTRKSLIEFLECDLKRIFIGIDIIVHFQEGIRISFHFPIHYDYEQRFPFKPIILVLKKYSLEIDNINFYKGKSETNIIIMISANSIQVH